MSETLTGFSAQVEDAAGELRDTIKARAGVLLEPTVEHAAVDVPLTVEPAFDLFAGTALALPAEPHAYDHSEPVAHTTSESITTNIIRTPSMASIAQFLQGPETGLYITDLATRFDLWKIAGARAVATYKVVDELVHSPAIVLEDGTIGVLHNASDTRETASSMNTFEDVQQLLLAAALVRSKSGIGVSHDEGVAELGHANVMAVTTEPWLIDAATHNLADVSGFTQKISESTTIVGGREGEKQRPTTTIPLAPASIARLTFLPDQQAPLPLVDEFDVSAGLAFAAKRTQGDKSFDIGKNAEVLAEQLDGGHA